METPRGEKYSSYSFMTSVLEGVSGQPHAQTDLNPLENIPGTYFIGGWVDLRAGLDTEARGNIFCLCWGSNPFRAFCSYTILSELPQLINRASYRAEFRNR
jgi:hypothetical protein